MASFRLVRRSDVRGGRRPGRRSWLGVAATLAVLGALALPASAHAAAQLTVTKTATAPPLLGGTATYTVTVQNSGDTKAYNLSLVDVLSSSRPNPQGTVSFVSAQDASGAAYPTSVATSAITGDTTIQFLNIRDLAPTESYRLTFTVDLSGDPSWRVNDLLNDTVTATVAQFPNGTGAVYSGSASDSDPVLPIKLISKTTEQSTGVEQATGTEARVFHYSLNVQNNYVNATGAVVVTDTLPDGLEFLGVTSGPAPDAGYPRRDPATGVTTVRWSLGAMSAAQVQTIRYAAGIRYDYYGTDDGGTDRPTADFGGTPGLGAPIADKTTFVNTADLTATYQGTPVTDTASSPVTAAYLTIAKSASPTSGGNGTVVAYTLTYSASQYYAILKQAPDSITVTDVLPDGQSYNDDATPAPSSVWPNSDGTTTLIWDGTALAALAPGSGASITFTATVDDTWRGPVIGGLPVIAGDSLTNNADVSGTWADQVDATRANGTSTSHAAAGFSTSLPLVSKQEEDPPGSGTWVQTTSRTVGDTVRFRVRFNTTDGLTPTNSDIAMGNIAVTDWLPPGMSYSDDLVVTPSSAGDFTDPGGSAPPLNVTGEPTIVSLGGMQGLQWYLGNVARAGWWQATFTAHVDDVAAVADGVVANNLWQLTGVNTFGAQYSDRAAATVDYTAPLLTLTKKATPTSGLLPGDHVTYTTTIVNSGHAAARDVLITDTLPVGMRLATPTIDSVTLDGTALAPGVDYVTTPVYDPATGVLSVDLETGAVHTAIPAGATLTLVYTATVDTSGGVAGATLTNLATVGYNTQADGSGRATPGTNNVADPNTDAATVSLANLLVTKTAAPTTPVTVGDTLTYTLQVTVPKGEIGYWPSIQDVVNRDGLAWDPSLQPSLQDVSGTPDSPAAFAAGFAPAVNTAGSNSTTFTWPLADPVDNRGQTTPYVFKLTFRVLVTGLEDNGSWEFWPATAGDQIGDRGRVYWNTTEPPVRPAATDRNAQSALVQSNVDQPLLTLVKTVTSTGPYAGGSQVKYQTTITNTGWSTAYDITWQDSLPAGLEAPQLLSVTGPSGALTPGVDYAADFAATPQTIDFDGGTSRTSLAPGASIVVAFTAQVRDDVGSGATLVNTADVDWASKDGAPAGSRVYDDSPQETNYTLDTSFASITTRDAALTKDVSPATARIGETLTYTVRVTVPAETVAYAPSLTDVIATDGLRYVPGSAAITYVSGDPQTAAALTGVTEDTTHPAPGSTLDFALAGAIDNADPGPQGDTDYVFDLTFQMQVTGKTDGGAWLWDAAAGPATSVDTATFAWSDGVGPHSSQANATETIDQPVLTMTKSFSTHAPASAATPVDSSVVIANSGWATAYEDGAGYDFVDTPPSCFAPATNVTVTHSTNGVLAPGSDYAVSYSGTTLQIEYLSSRTDLAPGETLTIAYRNAFVQPPDPAAPAPGATYTNAAQTSYTSMPGDVAGERTYGTDASDSLTMAEAGITKTNDAPGGVATIGQSFQYTVGLNVPDGTTLYSGTVTDTVPDGLSVTGTAATVGTTAYAANPDGTTTVTWTLPPVWQQGAPPTTPTLQVAVTVNDTYHDGAPLSGLPAGLGSGQDVLHNVADLDYLDGPAGAHHNDAAASDVTIVEPHLTISKDADPTSAGPGDPVTFTVKLGDDGTSPAHDLAVSDQVPVELFAAGASPVITSVSIGGVPLIAGADYIADTSGDPVTLSFAPTVTLDPGAVITIVMVSRVDGGVTSGRELTNVASVTGASLAGAGARTYGPVSDDAMVTTLAPALTVAKAVVGDATVNRYDDVAYSVVVTNSGDAPASDVAVNDVLPVGDFSYVAGSTSAVWPGGSSTADPAVTAGSHLTWDLHATLAPGQQLTLTYRMHVGMVALDDYTNVAAATGADGGGAALTSPTDAAAITVVKPATTDPSVGIVKSLAKGQPATVGLGDPIRYTIVVTNTGDTALATVPLTDTYDRSALQFVSASPAPQATAPAGTLTWTDLTGAGVLAPGRSITVAVKFTARRYSGTVVNTASVDGAIDEYLDPVASVQDTADVRIHLTARMTALKTGADLNGGTPAPGDIVGWKIVVKNVGQAPLTNVLVTDTVGKWQTYQAGSIRGPGRDDTGAPHMRWTIPNLAPGRKVTVSFHTVIDADTPGGSEIANQARAGSDQTRPIVTDDPFTTKPNDATIIDPRAPSHAWILWAVLASGVGAALVAGGLRGRRARSQALAPTPTPDGAGRARRRRR